MEEYYSSDDDVCWGPPTLREVKRALKRPIDREHINRRRTIGYNSPLKHESNEHTPEPDHIKEIIEDVSKLSIKSTYYTPNETMHPEKVEAASTSKFCEDVEAPNTSRFCEQMSKILDDTEPTTYVTAATDLSTESLLPQSIAIIDKLKCTLDSIMLTKKNFKVGSNVTMMGNRVQGTDLIDNIDMTLAPIESSDEDDEHKEITNNIDNIIQKLSDDNSAYEDDLCIKQENFVDSAFQPIKLSEVIEISDDESIDDHEIARTFADSDCQNISGDNEQDYELNNSNRKLMTEIEENFDNHVIYDVDELSIEEKMESEMSHLEKNNEILRFQGTQSQYEDISCVDDMDLHKINNKADVFDVSNNDSEASFEYKCMKNTRNDVYSIEDENKSERSDYNTANNEDISISDSENMYEENKENDKSEYVFDDTLEEINRALKEGLDYDSPSEELKSPVSEKSSTKKVSYESKLKPPNDYNILKTAKPQMEQTPDFKQPMRPMRSATPMHQRNALNFREIVSPVAVYIKSSTTPLQKNVNLRMMDQLPKKVVTNSPSTKQKFCALPEVVYRPASKKCLTKEKEIKFGGKIEKLISAKPEVIRHEKKFTSKPINVQKRLLDNNLTINSSQSSIMDATQDVSVLTSKKTFIR